MALDLCLQRKIYTEQCTIGELWVGAEMFCHTIEPSAYVVVKQKPHNELKLQLGSLLKKGKRFVTMRVRSPLYCDYQRYPFAAYVKGFVPRITKIPVRQAQYVIVPYDSSTAACVGEVRLGRYENGQLFKGVEIWQSLLDKYLLPATKKNEKIILTITDDKIAKEEYYAAISSSYRFTH